MIQFFRNLQLFSALLFLFFFASTVAKADNHISLIGSCLLNSTVKWDCKFNTLPEWNGALITCPKAELDPLWPDWASFTSEEELKIFLRSKTRLSRRPIMETLVDMACQGVGVRIYSSGNGRWNLGTVSLTVIYKNNLRLQPFAKQWQACQHFLYSENPFLSLLGFCVAAREITFDFSIRADGTVINDGYFSG